MSKDSSSAVRNMVIKRLGMDNCAEMFIHDKNVWIHRSAMEAAPLESIDYVSIINQYRESAEERAARGERFANADFEASISVLLKKIPKEQLPYFLDLIDLAGSSWHQQAMRDVIKARMSL